jgi:hypothetical protein
MPITINGGSTATYFDGWDSFLNPTAYTVPYTTTSGGTTTTSTIKDATKAEVTTLNAFVNNTVFCSETVNSVVNNTPTICDTTTFPNVVTLANGTGQVALNTDNGALASTFTCSISSTFANSYISGYTTGSLTKSINDLVLSAVGANPSPSASFMNVYSSGNIKNTNQYTKNIIDLSPFAENGSGRAVVLVSPRHITSVSHYPIFVGNTITFRDKDGVAQTRTVISATDIGADNWIGYLDDVVSGITPYSVLPANATTTIKIPLASENTGAYGTLPLGIYGFTVKRRFPFGGGDYIRQVQLGVITNISGSLNSQVYRGGAGVLTQAGTLPTITNVNDIRYPYRQWFTSVSDGDSGSPTFLPTGLTTATGTPLTLILGSQSTVTVGTSLSSYITEINTAMNAIKSGGDTTVYALDQINVSQSAWWNSFTSY